MFFVSLLVGILAVVFSVFLIFQIKKTPPQSEESLMFSRLIKQGAKVFLMRQFRAVALLALIITLFIAVFGGQAQEVWLFIIGLLVATGAALFAIFVSSETNIRTAEAAKDDFKESFQIALAGGQAVSLFVIGFGLFGLVVAYYWATEPLALIYYVFGVSLIAFFIRIGGGIYTKSADIAADSVGKLEENIPEDDCRNPAVLADQVGDNVGDLAGTSADLLESFLSSVVAAMILGSFIGKAYLTFPLWLAALSLLACFIGSFLIRLPKEELREEAEVRSVERAVGRGKLLAAGLFLACAAVISLRCFGQWQYFLIVLIGLLAGLAIGALSGRYTMPGGRMVSRVVSSSRQGAASVLSEGMYAGLISTFIPALIVSMTIFLAYHLGGFYGVAIGAVGVLGTLVIELTAGAFGPMVDNAGGIVQALKLGPAARKRTETLDSIGNSMAAVGKSFAITAAAFTAVAWLSIYLRQTLADSVSFLNPSILAGLLLGASLTFLFCALIIRSVNIGARQMIEESRRQLRETVGLKEGRAEADYRQPIKLATSNALRGLIGPGVIALLIPLSVGWWLGPETMGGILAGSLITAFPLALFMAHSGAIWDNAKKRVEAESDDIAAHQAALAGDLVGDPLKDAAAPALNILIKLIGVVTLIFVSLFVL
ncbi:MAG TPA: sodium-translocating pyrophosphatase [Candidatus Pacearchaeota archaeon]|nr:sodium-translocating pyrophosphatase [Candidatus Pacearchaeota archaeon]